MLTENDCTESIYVLPLILEYLLFDIIKDILRNIIVLTITVMHDNGNTAVDKPCNYKLVTQQ